MSHQSGMTVMISTRTLLNKNKHLMLKARNNQKLLLRLRLNQRRKLMTLESLNNPILRKNKHLNQLNQRKHLHQGKLKNQKLSQKRMRKLRLNQNMLKKEKSNNKLRLLNHLYMCWIITCQQNKKTRNNKKLTRPQAILQ